MKTYTYDEKLKYLNDDTEEDYYTHAWDGEYLNYEAVKDYPTEDAFLIRTPQEDTLFHIGQTAGSITDPATTMQCKRCMGLEFNVGSGSYFTAIKCVKCKWEICVHEG